MPSLFTSNIEYISSYHSELSSVQYDSNEIIEKVALLLPALNHIALNAEEYDVSTGSASPGFGDQFQKIIRTRNTDEVHVRRLFYIVARLVRESTLRRANFTSSEQEILDYFYRPDVRANKDDAAQADFIQFHVPHILLERVGSSVSQLEARMQGWSASAYKDTDALESRIAAHKSDLSKLDKDFNFVGLSSAFKKMIKEKKSQKWLSFWAVLSLGLLSIAIPVSYLASGSIFDDAIGSSWAPATVAKIAGAIAIEIIILYYFRITMRSYLVVRSQITNLELRYALCAFIDGYLDFAKNKGSASLSGFESLIFSRP